MRRQLVFQSYIWDRRLIHAASPVNFSNQSGLSSSISEDKERPMDEKLESALKPGGFSSTDCVLVDSKLNKSSDLGGRGGGPDSQPDVFYQESEMFP